jgi:NAD+ synthase
MLEITLPDYAEETIINFIRDFVGDKDVVLGLSGGLDSSVVAKLCVMALGKERVLAVHMPDKVTPSEDSEDAKFLAQELGVEYRVIPIDEILEKIKGEVGLKKDMSIANLKVRIRMLILYSIANEEGRLVAGTSNKSELLVGYFTKYGDGASDFAPIGDLYKTQVRLLAERIGIPKKILEKVPRAGLLPGQTDEGEMGVDYDTLDKILAYMELGFPSHRVSKMLGLDIGIVDKVYEMHERSRHKRVMLYIPKIGVKTVNTDWRE